MYDKNNDASRLFLEDSRDKKRTAIGIHARASRRGYLRGGMKMPSDFLSNKEKKKLNGEVRTFSMYEEYKNLDNCNLEDILKKDKTTIKNILTIIKANNSCAKICNSFKVSNGKLYTLYNNYDVEFQKKPRKMIETDKPSVELISTAKFKLMDSVQKGEYINKTTKALGISVGALGLKLGMSKSNLAYYVTAYNKKNKNILTEVPKEETEQLTLVEDTGTPSSNSQMEDYFHKKVLELEEENKKLIESIATISKETTENNFKGLKININGEYNKAELSNRLLSLDYMTFDNKRYSIKLCLEEII